MDKSVKDKVTSSISGTLKGGQSQLKGGVTNSKSILQGKSKVRNNFRFDQSKKDKDKVKSTQSDKNKDIVLHGNKIANPKKLITKSILDFYKLQQVDQSKSQDQPNKLAKGFSSIMMESSMRSQQHSMDASNSEFKMSSSQMQGQSSFMESKDYTEGSSQDDRTERREAQQKKKGQKELELDKLININLGESETQTFFFLPSCKMPKEKAIAVGLEKANKNYEQLLKDKIGSDNFKPRAAQTFNYQPKPKEQQTYEIEKQEIGVQATVQDIFDSKLDPQKSEIEVLQQNIAENIDKQLKKDVQNPFFLLPTSIEAIELQKLQEIPGAQEYYEREEKKNQSKTNTRAGISGLYGGTTNMNKNLASGISQNQLGGGMTSYIGGNLGFSQREDSKMNSNSNMTYSKMRQDQTKIQGTSGVLPNGKNLDEMQAELIKKQLKELENQPHEEEVKIFSNERFKSNLNYVERILHQKTYKKQIISYRNYPEFQFDKNQENQGKMLLDQQDGEEQAQKVKKDLEFLFSFNCELTKGKTITCADWNYSNNDLLAVSYGDLDIQVEEQGMLCFWTLKNPHFPEKIITYPNKITACKFSEVHQNLIAVGTSNGNIAIFDIRLKGNKPILENIYSGGQGKHADAIWELQWIGGKGEKNETLISISSDGRIVEWSIKKGLEYTNLMNLKRVAKPNQKQNQNEVVNFRTVGGFSFDFIKDETSMYLAATEDATIHRCSKSYQDQYLDSYFGHSGPIYKIQCNPFWSDVFLTCSADWSIKLWN